MPFWDSSCGGLHLELTEEEAGTGMHQGDCEQDVLFLLTKPNIATQVAEWDEEILRDHLREYGAWDDDELSDHSRNIVRQLWLACGDIKEGYGA